jgi:hypothetical protein
MTIHWKALEDHFMMVSLVFQFNHIFFWIFLKTTIVIRVKQKTFAVDWTQKKYPLFNCLYQYKTYCQARNDHSLPQSAVHHNVDVKTDVWQADQFDESYCHIRNTGSVSHRYAPRQRVPLSCQSDGSPSDNMGRTCLAENGFSGVWLDSLRTWILSDSVDTCT